MDERRPPWQMDCEEDVIAAEEAALALSALPFAPEADLPLRLSGRHATAAAFAPLSSIIRSIEPPAGGDFGQESQQLQPSPHGRILEEAALHLPLADRLVWPLHSSRACNASLVSALLHAADINEVFLMPLKAARTFARAVRRDVDIHLQLCK